MSELRQFHASQLVPRDLTHSDPLHLHFPSNCSRLHWFRSSDLLWFNGFFHLNIGRWVSRRVSSVHLGKSSCLLSLRLLQFLLRLFSWHSLLHHTFSEINDCPGGFYASAGLQYLRQELGTIRQWLYLVHIVHLCGSDAYPSDFNHFYANYLYEYPG